MHMILIVVSFLQRDTVVRRDVLEDLFSPPGYPVIDDLSPVFGHHDQVVIHKID